MRGARVWHSACLHVAPMASETFHCAVADFKRRFIEAALHAHDGNRTHAARALGLQRTYLLRLIRTLEVDAPPSGYRANLTGRILSPKS